MEDVLQTARVRQKKNENPPTSRNENLVKNLLLRAKTRKKILREDDALRKRRKSHGRRTVNDVTNRVIAKRSNLMIHLLAHHHALKNEIAPLLSRIKRSTKVEVRLVRNISRDP